MECGIGKNFCPHIAAYVEDIHLIVMAEERPTAVILLAVVTFNTVVTVVGVPLNVNKEHGLGRKKDPAHLLCFGLLEVIGKQIGVVAVREDTVTCGLFPVDRQLQ